MNYDAKITRIQFRDLRKKIRNKASSTIKGRLQSKGAEDSFCWGYNCTVYILSNNGLRSIGIREFADFAVMELRYYTKFKLLVMKFVGDIFNENNKIT